MGYALYSAFVGITALLAGWGLVWIHWHGQAFAGAHGWMAEQQLSVADWSMSVFRMHPFRPSIRFVASNVSNHSFDVELRFRVPMFGPLRLAEIECRPSGDGERIGAIELEL